MDEVSFERTFGNEKWVAVTTKLEAHRSNRSSFCRRLRLTFSISDLDNPPDTSDLEAAATEETSGEDDVATFPIRCSLFVTKPSAPQGTGALVMDLLVEDGQFVIDNASFYEDAKLAEEMTAEGDWKRRGTYVGPSESTCAVQPPTLILALYRIRPPRCCGPGRVRSLSGGTRGQRAARVCHSALLRIQRAKGVHVVVEERQELCRPIVTRMESLRPQ